MHIFLQSGVLREFYCVRLVVSRLGSVGMLFLWSCLFGLITDQRTVRAAGLVDCQSPPINFTIDLNPIATWFSADNRFFNYKVAWGDVDGDGDLDLATGNIYITYDPYLLIKQPITLYLNQGGELASTPAWTSTENNSTTQIAWVDVDRDGDLDLSVASFEDPIRLYINGGDHLQPTATWQSPDGGAADIAWGDTDGDGYPELAAWGDYLHPTRIFHNQAGVLEAVPSWQMTETNNIADTWSIAWGDMNGDGWLDLAVGNHDKFDQVYLNQAGTLNKTPAWQSRLRDNYTTSVAWGDVDNDGDLDLAVGSANFAGGQETSTFTKIYLNENHKLTPTPAWIAAESDQAMMVDWGDMDNDGSLDLVVGNNWGFDKVYRNEGRQLNKFHAWQSADSNITSGIALGDMDGDGDLDLAASGIAPKFYKNEGALFTQQEKICIPVQNISSLAWGDMDGNGKLDLAVGNDTQVQVFPNHSSDLEQSAIWHSSTLNSTRSLAWGDMNGDGKLDLAVGNYDQQSKVYLNIDGILQQTATWTSVTSDRTTSIAWGDVEGDGDLDLAIGNEGQPTKVYLNVDGILQTSPTWLTAVSDSTMSVAWGDVDGDGDLDLAVGNYGQPNKVYLNIGGKLQTLATWVAASTDNTRSIAWGDMDGDGKLDLAVGNRTQPNKVYRNSGGMLQSSPSWVSVEGDETLTVAWGDLDGDGDLDLVAGNWADPTKIYLNHKGQLATTAAWSTVYGYHNENIALGDIDSDGDLDLAVGNEANIYVYTNMRGAHPRYAPLGAPIAINTSFISSLIQTFSGQLVNTLTPANFYAVPGIRQGGVIPITYSLFQPDSAPVRQVSAVYSVDGGGRWYPASATGDTKTTDLSSSPYPTQTVTNTHIFNWDVFNSGLFGQSDNVIVRIEALPSVKPLPNQVSGPYQRPFIATQTFPFRVRGSQVRVLVADTQAPVAGALVYRLPQNQARTATLYTDQQGKPFTTDSQGYLQGRGEIAQGDQLIALWPITATSSYTLYYTSATPNTTGVDAFTVNALGVQTLTVAATNPLLLFNLDIALEWDARRDAQFMTQLQQDLHHTAELLYDWSNGQATLGRIRLFQDAKRYPEVGDWQPWLSAHIRLFVTSHLRPSAAQGGVVDRTVADPTKAQLSYAPGQVYMGATWNRFGDATGSLGEDWPRTLAHELSHYLFYLDDNYLGLNEDRLLVPVNSCPGAMADPYRDDNSEFHPSLDWLPGCANTLSHQATARSDWATIHTFYPQLNEPMSGFNSEPGPTGLPLALPQLEEFAVQPNAALLSAPIFSLAEGGRSVVPDERARAFLFQADWLTDLGGTAAGLVIARGARLDDRLCVFDPGMQRQGCKTIKAGDSQLALAAKPDWQPQVLVTPVTSTTVQISVTNVPIGLALMARLYPLENPASAEIALSTNNDTYIGAITVSDPALAGYLHIWVVEPEEHRRETVVDYTLGGNPGRIWSRGGRIWSRGGRIWSRGGRLVARDAPIISGDGQVILYTDDLMLDPNDEWFYTIQAATVLPNPPSWTTVVGRGYWLKTSGDEAMLQQASLSFNYLGSEVPPGQEQYLRLYFCACINNHRWEALDTTLAPASNVAAALSRGSGLYVLMSSLPVVLPNKGLNLFQYPAQATVPITQALASIDGKYTTVYHQISDAYDGWKVYDINAPSWVNDLTELEFQQLYWINLTEPVTVEFNSGSIALGQAAMTPSYPPATYYGVVSPSTDFIPVVGMAVTAWVNDQLCGEGRTLSMAEQIVYKVDVLAGGISDHIDCGAVGRTVTLKVGDYPMLPKPIWNNGQVTNLVLSAQQTTGTQQRRIHLPVVTR